MSFGTVKIDTIESATKTVAVDEIVFVSGIASGETLTFNGESFEGRVAEGGGTVTSVDLQAPSGFVASGGPIVLAGTLALAHASGFQAYTTAEANKLEGIASGATANEGTVTSVELAMPSGLVVSGSPITTSGEIAVTYADGFQAYTTAESEKLATIASGATANLGTVTEVALVVPSGLEVTGSPITASGELTISYASGFQAFTTAESDKLQGIASGATANLGTVTEVALTVPSGLEISGSPITASGELAVVHASGFQAFTTAESEKLQGVASGATANLGTVTAVALTMPSGLEVSGSPITASGELAVVYASGVQAFTTAEANKLATVASGAQANEPTNLTYSGDTRFLGSSTGSGVTLPLVSTSTAGLQAATGFGTITYAATVDLDLAVLDGQANEIVLTGALGLTASNLAKGRWTSLLLDPGASERTITFPVDWRPVGPKPATIPANKIARLTLECWDTTASRVVFAIAIQP
jgi:hypothetical protein